MVISKERVQLLQKQDREGVAARCVESRETNSCLVLEFRQCALADSSQQVNATCDIEEHGIGAGMVFCKHVRRCGPIYYQAVLFKV